MTLIIGIDDAGRGPVLGPMILAGVLITKEQEKTIKKVGAKDSKLLSHPQRIAIAKIIRENSIASKIVKAYPEEIDSSILSGTNLNTLEAKKMAEVINNLNNRKEKIYVIVDCPSTNITAWRNKLLSFIKSKENLDVKCEHKADFNYTAVSAASILAKVAREEEVLKLKKQFAEYGDVGSGYPSDPVTVAFLKVYGKELTNSGIFRKTWATWKSLFPQEAKSKSQKTLKDF